MNNPFLNNNVDEIFNHHFVDELIKKENKINKEKIKKNQQIYEYKFNKLQELVVFLDKVKSLNLMVKPNSDFDIYQFRFTNETVPFDYIIRESVNKENHPSPAIFIENPMTIEISISNNISVNETNYVVDFYGIPHPDRNLIKHHYHDIHELMIDLSKFFVKNSNRL